MERDKEKEREIPTYVYEISLLLLAKKSRSATFCIVRQSSQSTISVITEYTQFSLLETICELKHTGELSIASLALNLKPISLLSNIFYSPFFGGMYICTGNMYSCMFLFLFICMYIYMHSVCIYIYIYIYIYIHTRIHTYR